MAHPHSSQRIGVRDALPGVVYPPVHALRRYVDAGALGFESLADGLRAAFTRHASRIALDGPAGAVSYAMLDADSERLAAALLRQGLAPLDRVVFQMNNSYELVTLWVACLKAGLIPLCTLAPHREHEIGYLATHADAVLHAVDGDDPRFDGIGFARAMQDQVPTLKQILRARGPAVPGVLQLRALIESIDEAQARCELAALSSDPFQVAVFQLSGGTSGVPKIIPRFGNEYLAMMRLVADCNGYRPDDTVFIPLPMMHNLNMGCFLGPFLLSGGRVLVAPDLRPETLIDTIRRFAPTWLVLGPLAARIESAIAAGELDFSQVRGIVAPNGARRLREQLKAPALHIFGMTEGVIMFTRPGEDPIEAQDRTVGRPISPLDQVRILKPGTEEEAASGEDGEPAFQGPYTIHGYYRADERNREAFTSDGFYRSGDLMRTVTIDGRTYYEFRGRLKDVVDRGGEKINCEEVERVLLRHPAVAAVAVVGMPDPVYGERLCACVIPAAGRSAPDIAQLGAFLQQQGVAKFKWPERVETMSEFPTTQSGKLSKPALKQWVAGRVTAERTIDERALAAQQGRPADEEAR
ncbi:MAG: AMP-binding protein [Burkholderiaceae bacterium]